MGDDIVERLRAEARELDFDPVSDLLLEAAREIEHLRSDRIAKDEEGSALSPRSIDARSN